MREKEYFTLSRHKDGEFYAIFEHLGTHKGRSSNCDRHTYFKDMGKALLNTLTDPRDYIYGMQPMVHRKMLVQVEELFCKYNIHLKWYASDMFHHANENGEFFPFLEQLRDMNVVIIGPERILPIEKYLINVKFVTIPQQNCWLQKDGIEAKILNIGEPNTVYLFSASMATAVMIHDLYPLIGKDSWMFDFGSIWESLLGINIRSYQRGMKDDVRRRNLGE